MCPGSGCQTHTWACPLSMRRGPDAHPSRARAAGLARPFTQPPQSPRILLTKWPFCCYRAHGLVFILNYSRDWYGESPPRVAFLAFPRKAYQ